MSYTDTVQMEYDSLTKELESFIEILQRDLASMVRTQEQATRVLNCPASDEEKKEALGLMRSILVSVIWARTEALGKEADHTERLAQLLLKFNELEREHE